VIVGGGVIGAATAFFAEQAGLRCVVLEKRPALCTLTTPASTGAFRLQFDNPEEVALVRESIEFFDRFREAFGVDLCIQKSGYLFCATTDWAAERERHFVEQLHGWGVSDVELLTGDEARYRFPYLSQDVIQARFRVGDGWLDPKRLTLGYARASRATFCLDTPAVGFTRDGARISGVETPGGRVSCGAVVIAAGPFSGVVAELAGLHLDLRPTIRQKMVVPDLPAIPAWAPMTIEAETAAHWRPWRTPRCRPVSRSKTCRRGATSPSRCSTPTRRAPWPGSARSGVRSGRMGTCTGPCRPGSTTTRRTIGHCSVRLRWTACT
jgi:sarcosine oxidase subunit beta